MERLDKVLASTGRWSRREVKELIREGRVLVDGHLAGSGEQKVDPAGTALLVDGQAVAVHQHPPFLDELLCLPPGPTPRGGQYLVQPLHPLVPPFYRFSGVSSI